MIITDVFPVIVKIIKYCMVIFAVVEFAKGFVSEAESTDPADRDIESEQCTGVHRRKPQSQSSTEEESLSVLAAVEERKAKCRKIIRAASKRRWQQRARGRREISLRRMMMMMEKRLAAILRIVTEVSFLDVFWALSFVLYYVFGLVGFFWALSFVLYYAVGLVLVGFVITQALSSLVSFQSKGILWSWSRDVNTESGAQYKEELLLPLPPVCIILVGCVDVEEGRAKWR